jgi:hypothetical protein
MSKIKYQSVTVGIVTLLIVAAVYLLTFQTDICSNPSDYVLDTGEFQVALPLWGTVHFTGYPTYSLVGAIFASLLRWVGVPPAAGVALLSVTSSLVALGFIYALGVHFTGHPWAVGGAILVLALRRSFWINSVIAEVYAFGLALSVVSLWLAVRYDETRSAKTLYALAFVWGQSVAHHRLAVFVTPALLILVAPGLWCDRRRTLRLLAGSAAMLALAFAFYLYLPLRARMGAWTYGDPGTWQGFWFIFWASEMSFLFVPTSTVAGLLDNMRAIFEVVVNEWTAPGLVAVGLGLVAAATWRNTRRLGWALIAMLAGFLAFEFATQRSLQEVTVWTSAGLAIGLAILVARLWQAHKWIGVAGVTGLVALAGMSGVTHRAAVLALTRDTRGREVIQLLQSQMPAGRGGVEPTFMALWGGDYFAAVYGSRVTGELRGFRVVDHRADFQGIVSSGSRLITLPSTFVELPKSWWRERIGGAYLTSAGLGLVEIGDRPPLTLTDVPADTSVALGDGISLLAHQVKPIKGALHVTLYWQAAQMPTQNYSVFVHLSDKEQIAAPSDMIAQADSQNPVYGWYPTTKWGAGEIVREDYRLDVPPGKTPRLLAAGMYTRDAAGAFHNLGVVNLRLSVP